MFGAPPSVEGFANYPGFRIAKHLNRIGQDLESLSRTEQRLRRYMEQHGILQLRKLQKGAQKGGCPRPKSAQERPIQWHSGFTQQR